MQTPKPTRLPLFALNLLLVVIFGSVIRFTWLDQKVYWLDEAITSIHLRGYVADELYPELVQAGEMAPADFVPYQRLSPQRGLLDVISVLARRDPHLGVVYFILLRLWAELFGASVAALRAFSALCGALMLPVMYGLCRELYGDARFGWIGAALLAVSPFFFAYSQEARPYALWAFFTVAATFALLRAMRLNRWQEWLLYGLTVGLGMATQLLMAPVLLAHGLTYAVATGWWSALRQRQWPRPATPYLAASAFGLVLYSPWALNTLSQQARVSNLLDWISNPAPWSHLLRESGRGFVAVFIDPSSLNRIFIPTLGRWPVPIILGAVLLLIAIAFVWLWYNAPRRASLLVTAMFILSSLTLLLPDLIWGGQRIAIFRYSVPAYVALVLAMTYLLGSGLFAPRLRMTLLALLLFGGVISWGASVPGHYWWHKGSGEHLVTMTARLNASQRPLLLMSPRLRGMAAGIGIVEWLEPHVRLQFLDDTASLLSSADERDIFVYNPTDNLVNALQTKGYTLEGRPYLDAMVKVAR